MPLKPRRLLSSARIGVVCGSVLFALGFGSLMITSAIFAATTASADHAVTAPLSDADVAAGGIAREVPPAVGSVEPSARPTAAARRGPAKVSRRSTASAAPSPARSVGSGGSGVSRFVAGASAGATTAQPSVAARPAVSTPTAAPRTSSPPAPSPTPVRSTSGGSSPYVDETAAAQWLFGVINQNRAAHGRAALKWDGRLKTTTYNHCVLMAKNNTLSHQLPGEPGLAQRVTSQGVTWRSLGENAGYSYRTGNAGIDAAREVNDTMMAEGPGTGSNHYDNLMSSAFNYVGIAVLWDPANKRMWITEDFATE